MSQSTTRSGDVKNFLPILFVYWLGLQGGGSYAAAVPLPTARDLRLNHQQGKGQYDYFVIDLKGGQTLVLGLTTGLKGIEVQPGGDTFLETEFPYAGLEIHDAEGARLGAIEMVRERNMQRTMEVDASTPQRLYLLVGSPYEGMHKDFVVFRADVRNNFDGGADRDAGSAYETAVPLQNGRDAPENYLTRNDDADYFRIPTVPGERLNLRIIPENSKTHLQASFYDEIKKELGRARSARAGDPALAGGGFAVVGDATGSVTYLRIMRDVGDEATRYAIDFPEKPLPPVVKFPVSYLPRFIAP